MCSNYGMMLIGRVSADFCQILRFSSNLHPKKARNFIMEQNCRRPWRRSLRALFQPRRGLLPVDLQAEEPRRLGHWRALSTHEIKRHGLLLVRRKLSTMYRAKLPQKRHWYSSLHRFVLFLRPFLNRFQWQQTTSNIIASTWIDYDKPQVRFRKYKKT